MVTLTDRNANVLDAKGLLLGLSQMRPREGSVQIVTFLITK